MTDFFELPRPQPNPNLETLDMQSLGFQPDQKEPFKKSCNSSPTNSQENSTKKNPEIQSPNHYAFPIDKGENLFNYSNEDEKETYHESVSVAHDSTKKALAIIEESLESLKKKEEKPIVIVKEKATQKQKQPKNAAQKIKNIIDFGEADLGEVGEWVEKTANCNKQDDDDDQSKDSDFDEVFIENKDGGNDLAVIKSSRDSVSNRSSTGAIPQKPEKFGLGNAGQSNHKKQGGGYMLNNLKDKAKSIQLAQGVSAEREKEQAPIKEKKVFEEEKKLMEEELEKPEIHQEGLEHLTNHDWEEISKRNLEKLNNSNFRIHTEEDTSPVSFQEMWTVIRSLDLSKEKKNIIPLCIESLGFFDRLFFSCSVAKLPPTLLTERDQIFAYAKVPYDDKNPLHFRMISTFYKKLTDKKHCVRYGEHWEKIGFQGRDPATDLRGVGMLGVLQILAFLDLNAEFINLVYEHSLNEKHHFPLAVGLLNMTEVTLQALREGRLHNIALRQKSVMNAVNAFYFALFFKFFGIYKDNGMTEGDFGELKKKVGEMAKKNPGKLIDEFLKKKEVFCKMNSSSFGGKKMI